MKPLHALAAISLVACLVAPGAAWCGEGHDHGDAAPATSGPVLPRFAAVSERFELVGVLHGQRLTLYLDRADDNSPVTGAQIELEIAGRKFKAVKHGADEFEVVLTEVPKPGLLPITATVSAGTDTDLLAGELDIHEAAHSNEAAHLHSWQAYAAWVMGGVAALAALFIVGRRLLSSRQQRPGAVA